MIDVQEYLDKLRDLVDENRKLTLAVAGGLILILVLLLILLVMSENKKTAARNAAIESKMLVLDQPLLVPDGPAVPNGYVTSRQTEKHWSDEDVEQWFTEPDREEVEKLGDANDRIINEIIGAAP